MIELGHKYETWHAESKLHLSNGHLMFGRLGAENPNEGVKPETWLETDERATEIRSTQYMRNDRRSSVADGKEERKKNRRKKNQNAMKREAEEAMDVSSFSGSEEERNEEQEEEEEEEEAKSSKNSNQNSNLAPKEEEEEEEEGNDVKRKKILSNGVAVSGSFPTHRIKRIIRSEGDFRTSAEAIFLINNATEKFLESLAEDAYACSVQDCKKSINYKHLSSIVGTRRSYDFLSDFVPQKIRVEDALEERRLAAT